MTRQLAALLGVTAAILLVPTAASALPSTSLASVVADPSPPTTWPDRSVVLQPLPGQPCAAPVFGAPDDAAGGPALAETGIDRALQIAGLLALALAGVMGPRRLGRVEAPGTGTPG
jgi:hypothetical protein